MARPVLAFLTDFGTDDHYVGAMKGVALSICPGATLVDITHAIAPQDVLGGALELAAACPYFPPSTTFVVVVDPGVGTHRRGLAVEAGGHRFVGPDNGVLSLACDRFTPTCVVDLTDSAYARGRISRTFEGRDRFAPAAAWLASGVDLRSLGPEVTSWQRVDMPRVEVNADAIVGEVLRVDRFGNLITNIARRTVEAWEGAGAMEVCVAHVPIGGIVGTYGDTAWGSPCALFGSAEWLEIAVNGGHAARKFGLARGARVTVRRRGRRQEAEWAEEGD